MHFDLQMLKEYNSVLLEDLYPFFPLQNDVQLM